MKIQQTLIIVKPDGIAKGLVGKILHRLQDHNLQVVAQVRTKLSRQWVESLYEKERSEIYFEDVVRWVSSAPTLLLKVEGMDAVNKAKWQIIGRYPEGIRGQYSENWIKNVAHTPDSDQAALRELKLANDIFEKNAQAEARRLRDRMIFALTGMSECGKSTAGKYLDSKGICRFKIVKLFREIHKKWAPNEEFYEFLKYQEEHDPYTLWDAFIDELIMEMDKLGTKAVSIESLYGGGLGPYLKQKLGFHFCIIFIDVPLEIRLRRQMQRENFSNLETARAYLIPRDEIKKESGIPALKKIAGEIIDNSGTIEKLCQSIDAIVKNHLL